MVKVKNFAQEEISIAFSQQVNFFLFKVYQTCKKFM